MGEGKETKTSLILCSECGLVYENHNCLNKNNNINGTAQTQQKTKSKNKSQA